MKSKIVMFALGIFALAFFVSSVSALTLNQPTLQNGNPVPNPIIFIRAGDSQVVNISSSANFTITSSLAPLSLSSAFVNINQIGDPSKLNYTLLNFSLSDTGSIPYGGPYSTTLQINATNIFNASDSINGTTSININYIKSFCSNGDVNDTNVTMYVNIIPSGTSSQNTWNPLDTIQVQVILVPNGNTNLNNVKLQIGLINTNNNDDIQRMIWPSGQTSQYLIGPLSSNQGVSPYTFTFQINPQIFNTINSGTYLLMIKAFTQNNFCVDYAQGLTDGSLGGKNYFSTITIQPQQNYNKYVQFDPTTLPLSTSASCGQTVTISPSLYNVGPSPNSISQNPMNVILTIPDLGININQTVPGLSAGFGEQVPFSFNVPINTDLGLHKFYLVANYYYGNNNYRSDTFQSALNVGGNCVYATPDNTGVTAQLVSGGNAGQPLVIQATITNNGNKTVSYNFGLEGYSSWATLSSISPSNVTLAPGQSQDITLNMNVNQNANSGNQLLYLDTYSNGYLITKQPIQVPVTAGFSFSSLTGNAINSSNWIIWTFGLLIVALVILIIIVLVRLRRK